MEWLSDPRVLEWARLVAIPLVAVSCLVALVQLYRRRKARRTKGDDV